MATIIALTIAEQPSPARLHALSGLIAPEKRRKLARLKQQADAVRALYGDLLVRDTACKVLGVKNDALRFTTGTYGKPYLADYPSFHYNLSHSGNWIALIYGDQPVGIDVEKHKEADFLSLSDLCMTPAEQKTLRALRGAARLRYFYEIWTLKESYVKAVGKGLSLPLESFEVQVSEERALPGVRLSGTVTAHVPSDDQAVRDTNIGADVGFDVAPDVGADDGADIGTDDVTGDGKAYYLRTYEWQHGYTLSACSQASDLPHTIIRCEPQELDLIRTTWEEEIS